MNTIRDDHEIAMQLTDEARLLVDKRGLSKHLNHATYYFELRAARASAEEPSRSVLFRSAAWLAYWADEYEDAIAAVREGLKGVVHSEIKVELESVLRESTDALYTF